MKVFFGTPTYDRKLVCEYSQSMIRTMLQMREDKIEASLCFIGGDCFIDHARNQIVAAFLKTDCTDLIMIDSDQGWEVNSIRHLLVRPEMIVAGVVVGREADGKWHVTPEADADGAVTMTDGLMSVTKIGAAFIRIKREAIEKLIAAHPNDYYIENGEKVPALFRTGVQGHEFVGEDVDFCRKWLALGEKLYVMPDMLFQHVGRKRWEGNFYQHILEQQK